MPKEQFRASESNRIFFRPKNNDAPDPSCYLPQIQSKSRMINLNVGSRSTSINAEVKQKRHVPAPNLYFAASNKHEPLDTFSLAKLEYENMELFEK